MTAKKVLVCDWVDLTNPLLPSLGDIFDEAFPLLKCINIQADQIDNGRQARFVAQYSTDGKTGEGFYTRTMDFSCEILNSTESMTWANAGTPVSIPISTIKPTCDFTLTVKKDSYSLLDIWNTVGHVNDRVWQGAEPETILCLGVSVGESYDDSGSLLDVNLSYKFTKKDRSWNEAWRSAQQQMLEGIPQHYQVLDPDKRYYTTDLSKDSVPVWVSGAAGTAGWDRPSHVVDGVTKYMYDTIDLAGTLGLPTYAGDD